MVHMGDARTKVHTEVMVLGSRSCDVNLLGGSE